MAPQAPGVKVRIRFLGHGGRPVTERQWLKALLPAAWDEPARVQIRALAAQHLALFNADRVFVYPIALDLIRTRLLDLGLGGRFQHFAWELPVQAIPPLCEHCLACWLGKAPEPPACFSQGLARVFRCPQCGSLMLDDPQAGEAGLRQFISEPEFAQRFGLSPGAGMGP